MISALEQILQGALGRLSALLMRYLPAVLAAAVILLVAYLLALLARWLLTRVFKGMRVDRFLRQSGIASVLSRSGQPRTTRLVAASAYWAILLAGALAALSVFDSSLTTRMVDGVVLLFPKLVVAGLILVIGFWLAQFLGRSALVWAFNENLPRPRRLSLAVRVVVILAAVATAADQLDFGRQVFLAAFILLAGGAALAGGLALGLGGRDAVRRHLETGEPRDERSLWDHL
jgi:hypothetical protein